MNLLGNRWSAAVLGALFLGAHRFSEFCERTGAPPTMVADRLGRFTDIQVVQTQVSSERPDWQTYRLTEKGSAFFPVIALMLNWGHRWFHSPEGPALMLAHRGHTFGPELHCGACQNVLSAADIQVK